MIRVPVLGIHAPWPVLFSAAGATMLMLTVGAAVAVHRLIMHPPAWLRRRRCPCRRRLPRAAWWDDLRDRTWPHSEWTHVLLDFSREQERRRDQ